MRALVPLVLLVGLAACGASGGGGGSGAAAGTGAGSGSGGGSSGSGGGSSGNGGASGGGSGGGEIGDPCSSTADCTAVPGAECWTTIGGGPVPSVTFPGGFCSKACDTQSEEKECGEIAGCSSVGSSGGGVSATLTMCSPPCASDAECRQSEGYKCFQIIPGFGVCTPP
jgi:hypothetical protein